MTIEQIALDWARDYLKENEMNYIGNDEQIKGRIDANYPGGWETFYNETWDQAVA